MDKSTAVKIDLELKGKIEKYIVKGDNRFIYRDAKQFVDRAVLTLFKELKIK